MAQITNLCVIHCSESLIFKRKHLRVWKGGNFWWQDLDLSYITALVQEFLK